MKPYKINLFKTLSDKQRNLLNIKSTIKAWYKNDEEKININLNKEENQYSLESSNGLWNIEEFGLGLDIDISLENANILYGVEGIAEKTSRLSMVVTWKSSQSKDRGVVEEKVVDNISDTQNLKFTKYFLKHTYHGVLELNIRLVLKEQGKNEDYSINNTPGVIVGEVDKLFINLDGSGSLFPIINIHEKDKPLWSIQIDFTDPTQDLFIDSFKILLNTAHRDYVFIDLSNKDKYCSRLVIEIIQQSIVILLTKLLNDGTFDSINDIDYQEGSVLQVVKYMIDTKEFDISSVESIMTSVSQYFDKRGA